MPFTAPFVSHLQIAVPARFGGRIIAIMLMGMTVMATALGPISVAFLTDQIFGVKTYGKTEP